MERQLATVFGGSGFLGRYVVKHLAAAGWIVRVAVRDIESAQFLKPLGDTGQIVPVPADVSDPATVEPAVAGARAVVNLVGILYERGRRTFQRMHVDGARNVAEAAGAAGTERLVQMSAIGADTHSEAEYARTKALGEEAVLQAFPDAVVLRPSVVFGPEDDFFNRFAVMARFLPVMPVFETAFQPVYVGDVADAVMKAIDDPATSGNTYELGGPRVISFQEVMELVLRYSARRRLLLPTPLAVAAVQATFLEWLPVPPLTRDQVKLLGRKNVVAEDAKTLADLGIGATAVEAIVPDYLRRYRPPAKQGPRTP